MKINCRQLCGKMAVWYYMPSDGRYAANEYCDDCIHRGCSCNIDPETGEEDRDEQGRLMPCCEFGYDENGIDLKENREEIINIIDEIYYRVHNVMPKELQEQYKIKWSTYIDKSKN